MFYASFSLTYHNSYVLEKFQKVLLKFTPFAFFFNLNYSESCLGQLLISNL